MNSGLLISIADILRATGESHVSPFISLVFVAGQHEGNLEI